MPVTSRVAGAIGLLGAVLTLALPPSVEPVQAAHVNGVAASGTSSQASSISAAAATPGTVSNLQRKTSLQRQTGLTVSIDDVEPVALTPGKPLTLTGSVTNDGTTLWTEAQVYLEIGAAPATTRAELDTFASQLGVVGTRLVAYRLFDQIGDVPPGHTVKYHLTVPYHRLPITRTAGVYHVGVSVLAGNSTGRDAYADAQADTLVPLLPADRSSGFLPTSVLTLLPLTAPVMRQSNGNFLDASLVSLLSTGGRLHNVLDFALQAPRDSVQVVIDPALRNAVHDMAKGYVVQTLKESEAGQPGHPGPGEVEAAAWQRELHKVAHRQHLSLLPWGTPDASALSAHAMPGVVESAVAAGQTYAARNSLDNAIIGWQPGGLSTRLGLTVMHKSGTSVQVIAERDLPRLPPGDSDYPPSVVTLRTRLGPLTTVVSRRDVAGNSVTAGTSALQFRQDLIAEATVRSLLDDPQAEYAVFALPFDWNPGVATSAVDLSKAYHLRSVVPTTPRVVAARLPTVYHGPVEVPAHQPPYPFDVIRAITGLRNSGRILTGILRHSKLATQVFDQRLGEAGSAEWRERPRVAAAMIRQQTAAFAAQTSKVTVTGPTFVALSSASGRFPITVTNGLRVPITVRVHVKPQNPALHVDSIKNLQLAAGQRRDVQVVSQAAGSGLTQVRVRLSTPDHRLFGIPWRFNVRATQVGVIIWVAMGVGAAVLFGAAAVRVFRRIRQARGSGSPAQPEPGA